MRFFDTHTHLDYLAQDLNLSVSQLIENAQTQQVERILVVTISAKNFENVTACSRAEPQHIVYGLGLHPLYIAEHQRADLDLLEARLQQKRSSLYRNCGNRFGTCG